MAAELHWEPSRLWMLSDSDQALLIAHSRASGTIKAYGDHLYNKKLTAANNRKPKH